jgi:hypothetical protein
MCATSHDVAQRRTIREVRRDPRRGGPECDVMRRCARPSGSGQGNANPRARSESGGTARHEGPASVRATRRPIGAVRATGWPTNRRSRDHRAVAQRRSEAAQDSADADRGPRHAGAAGARAEADDRNRCAKRTNPHS